jgi:predicted PurR-regulated permease PerM
LFLILAGMLLGVGLNAMTQLLGRVIPMPQALRLAMVCVTLAIVLSGVLVLGGATIAKQATVLSQTIKSQLSTVKAFLEKNGVDTSYFDFGQAEAAATDAAGTAAPGTPAPATPHNLPSASTLASSGGAIVSQTLKVLLGTVSAVGNFFIVLFLGLAFAAQPSVYRDGLIFVAPARYRGNVIEVVDRIGYTLERWLLAQLLTMVAVFFVTWIGLALIGIPSSFILGIQAGLLAFIPTVGALIGGLIVVLASLATGWVAALSAFILFLGVHALESYVLTPIIQRQALDIPPATLFAFQILLGVVFGIWGLALALPLVAISKVILDYCKGEEALAA